MGGKPLLQVLSTAGLGSRRRLADTIKQGRVALNGQVVTDFRLPILANDIITIDGREVSLKAEAKNYIMLNKPVGVLSASIDKRGERIATDILPLQYRRMRLYPAGRLDKDSSGLLLLTNDGRLTYRLTHPRFEQEKEYLIFIKKELIADEIARLKSGLELEDGLTAPAGVSSVSEAHYNYSITIHEGRKRQVRRMLAALGHQVQALKRVRLGNLKLGSLKEGEARTLNTAEAEKALE
jgi:23S rRNA pseudouridine2605 synthase